MRIGTGRLTAPTVVIATTTFIPQIFTLAPAHPLAPASPTTSIAPAVPGPAPLIASLDGTGSSTTGSSTAGSDAASAPVHPFLERTLALSVADVLDSIDDRTPRAGDAGRSTEAPADGIAPASSLDPTFGHVVAIRLDDAPLRFGDLPTDDQLDAWLLHGGDVEADYERVVADRLVAAIERTRAERPGTLVTVLGLPLDRPDADPARLRASNERFAGVVDRLDLLVVPAVLENPRARRATLRRLHPVAYDAAGLRPLVHRIGDEWHAILPALGGPAGQRSDDVATPPALAAARDRDRTLPIRTPRSTPTRTPDGGDPGGPSVPPEIPGGGDPDDPTVPPDVPGGDPGGPGGPTIPPEEPDAPSDGDRPDVVDDPDDPRNPGDGGDDPDDPGRDIDFDGGTDIIRPGGDGGGGGGGGGKGGGDSGPVVEGGSGFGGSIVAPPRQGLPGQRGYERQAIARWNAVPFRDVEGVFEVGVVAFHMTGIRHVSFQLDGGPITTVAEPSVNPRTGTTEYWVRVDPSALADGVHELRAIAMPNVGEPRVLAGPVHSETVTLGEVSWIFNTNANGTLPAASVHVAPPPFGNDLTGTGTRTRPFSTLMRAAFALAGDETYGDVGGGTILLLPGEYNLGTYAWPRIVTAEHRWMTIRPASGVAEEDVRLVRSDTAGIRVAKLRLRDIRITPAPGESNVVRGNVSESLWIDDCSIVGETFFPDLATRSIISGFSDGIYATDVTVKDIITTPFNGVLERNVHIDGLLERAFGSRMVVGCSVRNFRPDLYTETDFHPDVWQVFAPEGVVENCITVDLEATDSVYAQGLFFSGHTAVFRDLAFANVRVDNTWNDDPDAIFVNIHAFEAFEHVLFVDSTFKGGSRYVEPGSEEPGWFSADDVIFVRIRHLVTGEPYLPDPDGPTSWTPGRWPGTLPWTSPSGIDYTEIAPWEPGGYPEL